MLRMDGFEVHAARTPDEAVALYASHEGAHYVAGGTDLVPNLKHRIVPARHLVSVVPPGAASFGDGFARGLCRTLRTNANAACSSSTRGASGASSQACPTITLGRPYCRRSSPM